ncbi:hypothetical protein HYW11_03905 [Candidatus Peregrinibacteria bacterium]|nr:hypothetical protein [Candidatus Peregrinibacteria bacterium]
MSDDMLPATKADIGRVESGMRKLEGNFQRLDGTVQKLDGTVQRLEKKFERLYEADDQILAVLGNMDKRLTGKIDDHEHRITRLEAVVA